MLNVRDHISPTIPDQFPALYREDGEWLVEFTKAYYEFNEQQMDRNIPKLRDIDTTLASFLIFFKKKYLNSLPLDTIVDTRFIIKHIQDLYKRKGSEESLRLLFRMFYDEDIEVFYPSTAILKPSESIWGGAVYLELTGVASISDYPVERGDKLSGDISGANAFVDNIIFVNFSGSLTPIAYLSNLAGTFSSNDSITVRKPDGTIANRGRLVAGSLTDVTINPNNRLAGQNVGDKLNFESRSSGTSATGTVESINLTTTGKIDFDLLDGGFGYSVAPAGATYAEKAAALALNETRISNQVVIVDGSSAVSSIKLGDHILADSVTASAGTVVTGGGSVVAYNHPLLYFKTESQTKAEFLTYVSSQITLAGNGDSTVDPKMLAIFNRDTEGLSTNYRLGDISNSGFDLSTRRYVNESDADIFEAYRSGSSITTAQTNWIEDRLLPAIYAAGFGHSFNSMAQGESVSITVGSNNSVPLTTISAYNATANFTVSSLNNTETVNVITDFIGDFADKRLAVIINASSMVNPGIYEIETTDGTTYTDASSQAIGTRFVASGPQAGGSGTVVDVVATNYGMSGTLISQGFNAETLNTTISDAFESKRITIGSIDGFITNSTGSDYENDVFTEVEYVDVSRFDKRDTILTFDSPSFLIEVGDIITQTVQIEDPTLATNDLVSYPAKGRFIRRDGNDFYVKKLSFYDFDEASTITIKNGVYTLSNVRDDVNSLPIGRNANFSGIASYEPGQIKTVTVDSTGYRYANGETVDIKNSIGQIVATGKVDATGIGRTKGKWSSSTSFLSDVTKKLPDNDYYQEYSYDISTIVDPEKYTQLIKDTVGVAGTKVFGSPLINSNNNLNSTLDVEFQVWNLSTESYVTEGSETMMTEFNNDSNDSIPDTTVRPGYTASEALVAQVIELDTTASGAITTSIGT